MASTVSNHLMNVSFGKVGGALTQQSSSFSDSCAIMNECAFYRNTPWCALLVNYRWLMTKNRNIVNLPVIGQESRTS